MWWLDDRTKQLMEAATNLRSGQDLVIEFKGGAPIRLTQEQVNPCARAAQRRVRIRACLLLLSSSIWRSSRSATANSVRPS